MLEFYLSSVASAPELVKGIPNSTIFYQHTNQHTKKGLLVFFRVPRKRLSAFLDIEIHGTENLSVVLGLQEVSFRSIQ